MKKPYSRGYVTGVIFASAIAGAIVAIAFDQLSRDAWYSRPAGLIVACLVASFLLLRGRKA